LRPSDAEYLSELNEYIAGWEQVEVRVAETRDHGLLKKLEALAAGLTGLQSKAKYEK
jgi:hypothetical protein